MTCPTCGTWARIWRSQEERDDPHHQNCPDRPELAGRVDHRWPHWDEEFGLAEGLVELTPVCYAVPGTPRRSSDWPDVRKAHHRAHPSCAACGGTKQVEVHHVKPFHLFPELELDPDNLLTLCDHQVRPCHRIFGHLYDWKKWNPYVVEDCRRMLRRREVAA